MLIDSHCHLGSHKFSPSEIPDLITRAAENGITRLITLATCEDDLSANLHLAHTHPQIHACLGIHPCDVHETRDDFDTLLRPHLTDPKVAAIGETGLDYFHPAPSGWTEADYHARQRHFLHRHFQLAKEAGLNIVIHTRDRSGCASFDDALKIYADYAPSVRAVFHCFPGPPSLAQRVIHAGGLISFTGIATFKNAQAVVETVKSTPSGSFMLETDSPYLAPVPHRGKRCEPSLLKHSAEAIAQQRGQELCDLARETTEVAENFFRLSPHPEKIT